MSMSGQIPREGATHNTSVHSDVTTAGILFFRGENRLCDTKSLALGHVTTEGGSGGGVELQFDLILNMTAIRCRNLMDFVIRLLLD